MLMPFNRLQALGKERFGVIKNQLMHGTNCLSVARLIQMEWGEHQDVSEKTLSVQLNRLRLQMVAGAFGSDVAKEIEKVTVTAKQPNAMKPVVAILDGVTAEVLGRMEELAEIQRKRVKRLDHKEAALVGLHLPALDNAITDYRDLLVAVQKMRFDLGADEFKGPLVGMRVQSASVTLPDGTNVQKSVYEATDVLDKIFDKRGIPSAQKLREA